MFEVEFLKFGLTHLDNAGGDRFTLACFCFSLHRTGLSVRHIIHSYHVFSIYCSAVSLVVKTELNIKITVKLSFCYFPSDEKDKRTWLRLIKYVK